jgi:uncharacterized lipoprotein YddW (UPF0748 family)
VISNRISLLRAVFFTALLLFGVGNKVAAAEATHRGMWIIRDQLLKKEPVDQFINFAERNGFTDLFVQVRGRGDAFYRSSIVPLSPAIIDPSFDPLQYILEQAHPRNIKVHAWLNTYLLWSSDDKPADPQHLLLQHPEWCTVDSDGKKDIHRREKEFRDNNIEGVYLSPLVPEVKTYLVEIIRELVEKYNVDGVHLDYIRYPKDSYDFNEVGRQRFKDIYGVDPILLSITNKSFFSGMEAKTIEQLIEKWNDFRRDAITELVIDTREVIIATRKPIALSAAVKPDPVEARYYFYQDWEKWLKSAYLDFAVPMNYTKSSEQFEEILNKFDPLILKDKIWMGIAVYNQGRYDALTKVLIARTCGFDNLVFFSYESFANQPNYFPTLMRAFNR